MPLLAQDIYEKIVYIRQNYGSQGAIELVGHSIGAHVAGQVGKLLKRQPEYELDRIIGKTLNNFLVRCSMLSFSSKLGLDPAGEYFKENLGSALKKEDAKTVFVLHTNMNKYGFGSLIGANDQKVNGGEKQPNCKVNVDFCSHNEAWNSFSQYLINKSVAENNFRIQPYVICLDVSLSMAGNRRLERAIYSANKIISNIKTGSIIGFVKFNGVAEKVNDIIEIKGYGERESLLELLPKIEAYGSTSIGAGLRLSLNMLQAFNNSANFCSNIVLISDGDQNEGESPQDVLPDLKDACVKVSSIALGPSASSELEGLSSATSGVVSYAMEDGSSSDMVNTIRALSYSFESDTVHLLSKEVRLGDDSENVRFIIDDTTGKDTVFSIMSYEIQELDVIMTSPNGKLSTSSSAEYFFDSYIEKGFRLQNAIAGQWMLTVTKISKKRRSIRSIIIVTADGTTHKLDEKPLIQLNAQLSGRVLEYPKRLPITAELKIGKFPIISAEVFANIQAPNQPVIRLPLYDDGNFPDLLANDGIYTNHIIKLPKPERYSVIVRARPTNTTMLAPKEINYFAKNEIDCEKISCTKISEFQREKDVGSVNLVSDAKKDEIPPHPVSDLRCKIESEEKKIISLEWTSPRDEIFQIQIKHYDIRALINGIDFENGLQFVDSDIVEGSLDGMNSTTKMEKISIRIPAHVWDDAVKNMGSRHPSVFDFALKSVGLNDKVSEVSNIASVAMEEFDRNFGVISLTQCYLLRILSALVILVPFF